MHKKICVVNIQSGAVMRTEQGAANMLIMAGTHQFTTKGKLKSFLNQQGKLTRNKKVIEYFDIKLDTNNTDTLPNGRMHTTIYRNKDGNVMSVDKKYPAQRLIVHY